MEKLSERCGEDRRTEPQEPGRYHIETSRCRPQCVQHQEHVHLRDKVLIIRCRQFQLGCSAVIVGRYGRVVVVKVLRRESDDEVVGAVR